MRRGGYPGQPVAPTSSAATAGGAQALEDAPSNTWAGLRIHNATHDVKYAEYRGSACESNRHENPYSGRAALQLTLPPPQLPHTAASPIEPSSTNFTIAFDLAADPYELVNHGKGPSGASAGAPSRRAWYFSATAGTHPLPRIAAWTPALLKQYSTELWALATCVGNGCP